MKKVFLVEIEYEEIFPNIVKDTPVLYDTSIQCSLENMMYGYACTRSISLSHGYEVNVKQLANDYLTIEKEIIDDLSAKIKMAKEDDESGDYIEGLYDAMRIAKRTD